jgi:phenylacetate 2-hydroxylase
VKAFCKEVLRFWTVIPMSLPRVSIKDVVWQGATIPAGTTFLMVSDVSRPPGCA